MISCIEIQFRRYENADEYFWTNVNIKQFEKKKEIK